MEFYSVIESLKCYIVYLPFCTKLCQWWCQGCLNVTKCLFNQIRLNPITLFSAATLFIKEQINILLTLQGLS